MVLCWIMRLSQVFGLLSFTDQIDLFAQMSACGDFYTAGETPRAPRAPSLAWERDPSRSPCKKCLWLPFNPI